MTTALDWQGQTGTSWADEWRRTDRSFAPLTGRLLERIAEEPGGRVLDIGCGAGELAIEIASARPQATVLGLDISPQLVASAKGRSTCSNTRFALGDAANWTEPAFAPDLLVSRHGVMFFSDPAAAFAHLARVSAPGARLVFSCFRAAALNGWASEIGRLLASVQGSPPPSDARAPDPHAPGPFAFADPEHVEDVLSEGWQDIGFEPVDFAYVAGAGDDPVADAMAYFRRIGPFAAALRALPDEARGELGEALRSMLAAHVADGRVVFSGAAWIVSARSNV